MVRDVEEQLLRERGNGSERKKERERERHAEKKVGDEAWGRVGPGRAGPGWRRPERAAVSVAVVVVAGAGAARPPLR